MPVIKAPEWLMPGVSRARENYDVLTELSGELGRRFDEAGIDYTPSFNEANFRIKRLGQMADEMEDYLEPHGDPLETSNEALRLLADSEFHCNYFRDEKKSCLVN